MNAFESYGVAKIATRVYTGRPLRDHLLVQVAAAVRDLRDAGTQVCLCVVQVGDHPASTAYIRQKRLACEKAGIAFRHERLAPDSEADLHARVAELGAEAGVHGIIVQTPLSAGWDIQAALDAVPAAKDVDGIATASIRLRQAGAGEALIPATPLGIMRLLEQAGMSLDGKTVGIVGRGLVVGAPLADILVRQGVNVVVVDKATPAPAVTARACDVLVSATGVANLITREWVKPGALLIDAGTTELTERNTMTGDVDAASVEGIAGGRTPVPGGVGPLTVASLLTNIVDAACLQLGRPRVDWTIDGIGAAAG